MKEIYVYGTLWGDTLENDSAEKKGADAWKQRSLYTVDIILRASETAAT